MNATILVVLAYLTNGIPLPNFFILPPGHPCNSEVAADYARRFIAPSLGEGFAIQDPDKFGRYQCLPVPDAIAPGPADPGAVPKPEEPDFEGEPLAKPQRDA